MLIPNLDTLNLDVIPINVFPKKLLDVILWTLFAPLVNQTRLTKNPENLERIFGRNFIDEKLPEAFFVIISYV